MAHFTSGRRGYRDLLFNDRYQDEYIQNMTRKSKISEGTPEIDATSIEPEILLQMLRRENELRLGTDYQQQYKDNAQWGLDGCVEVTELLQRQVIQ